MLPPVVALAADLAADLAVELAADLAVHLAADLAAHLVVDLAVHLVVLLEATQVYRVALVSLDWRVAIVESQILGQVVVAAELAQALAVV